jgi:serine/threonine protein kinase
VVGLTVSHYRIVSHLGGGGMGVVYRAEDMRLGRDVAIKFLPNSLSSDVLSLERFRREARVASRINHPHICTVYDIGEYEQQPFLVMELLEGETLKSWIGRARVTLPDLLKWSAQFCEALEAAHLAGIIHRDVKPANLFHYSARRNEDIGLRFSKTSQFAPSFGPVTFGANGDDGRF